MGDLRLLDPKILDDVSQKLGAFLPEGLQSVQKDIEKNFKTVLQNSFSRMDLVTREEFDVQSAVLTRTREKLEQLEKQVAALEAVAQQKTE